jgi:hypothetical protein
MHGCRVNVTHVSVFGWETSRIRRPAGGFGTPAATAQGRLFFIPAEITARAAGGQRHMNKLDAISRRSKPMRALVRLIKIAITGCGACVLIASSTQLQFGGVTYALDNESMGHNKRSTRQINKRKIQILKRLKRAVFFMLKKFIASRSGVRNNRYLKFCRERTLLICGSEFFTNAHIRICTRIYFF